MQRVYNLDDRLIEFSARVIDVVERLPRTIAGQYIAGQLVRSGTSPALHYGEAQAAESPADFIHKMKVCHKELRETYNGLRLVNRMKWCPETLIVSLIDESNQLVAIFFASITTAQKNLKHSNLKPNGKM